jgi:21S rRNA (uridine2791-2'-O)-methyltransferase
MAALTFSFDTLKTGGHFLCKYYQGTEEKAFETKLKRLFAKVHREKPDSSRTVGGFPLDVGGPNLLVLGV